jgi:hypothetical protein
MAGDLAHVNPRGAKSLPEIGKGECDIVSRGVLVGTSEHAAHTTGTRLILATAARNRSHCCRPAIAVRTPGNESPVPRWAPC